MSITIKGWADPKMWDEGPVGFRLSRIYEAKSERDLPATLIIGDEPVFTKEDLTNMVKAMVGVVKTGGIAIMLTKDNNQESEWMKHLDALRAEIKKHGITLP